MNRLRQKVAVLLLAAYVATGILLEVAHHDDVGLPSQDQATLAQHTCGNHEIHVPLDQVHPCLACFQAAQRVATPASTFVPDVTSEVLLGTITLLCDQPHTTDFLFTGKRGPPLS